MMMSQAPSTPTMQTYLCEHPGCGAQFNDEQGLKDHTLATCPPLYEDQAQLRSLLQESVQFLSHHCGCAPDVAEFINRAQGELTKAMMAAPLSRHHEGMEEEPHHHHHHEVHHQHQRQQQYDVAPTAVGGSVDLGDYAWPTGGGGGTVSRPLKRVAISAPDHLQHHATSNANGHHSAAQQQQQQQQQVKQEFSDDALGGLGAFSFTMTPHGGSSGGALRFVGFDTSEGQNASSLLTPSNNSLLSPTGLAFDFQCKLSILLMVGPLI